MEEDTESPADEIANLAMAELVCAVGHVCISASSLEWALTYLTGVTRGWDDPEYTRVLAIPGQPLREYQNLVSRLEAFGLVPDAGRLATEAGRLLSQRHRVVHSVMLPEARADGESLYEAWHARSDTTWPVVPGDLNALARDLAQCAAEATSFAEAWRDRSERDGWPDLSPLLVPPSTPPSADQPDNGGSRRRTTAAAPLAIQELADGVAFWLNRTNWPDDFHNTDYQTWATDNPHGNFTQTWWSDIQLPRLQAWIATRGSRHADLTARFTERITILADVWKLTCAPFVEDDITTITWDQVKALPDEVVKIKPTKAPSRVFTSKFCHFLLPKVFPVVDSAALGNKWPTYEAYFRFVQDEWESHRPCLSAGTDRRSHQSHRSQGPAGEHRVPDGKQDHGATSYRSASRKCPLTRLSVKHHLGS